MEFFDLDNYPKNAIQEVRADSNVLTLSGSSGSANITAGGLTKLATWDTSTTVTAQNFVSAWVSAYQAVGVVVTEAAGVLTFTSRTKEIAVSITTAAGDLTGAATAIFVPDFSRHRIFRLTLGTNLTIADPINAVDAAYARFETKVDLNIVTITGSSGGCDITAGGLTKTTVWNSTLTQTATDFVTVNAAAYLLVGLVLTSSTDEITFTPVGNTLANASVVPNTGDMDGAVDTIYTSAWGSKYDIAGGSITTQTVNGRDLVEGYYNQTEDRFQITVQAQALA